MLDAIAIIVAGLFPAQCCLMQRRAAGPAPCSCVQRFHEAIASGRLGEIGNFFSFASAYQYWQDVTASLGTSCPSEEEFRQIVLDALAGAAVRDEARSYAPARFRHKIIGLVGSVVFQKRGVTPAADAGVASVVLEDGIWKVRTYPGIFPGQLLVQAKEAAGRAGKEAAGNETQ